MLLCRPYRLLLERTAPLLLVQSAGGDTRALLGRRPAALSGRRTRLRLQQTEGGQGGISTWSGLWGGMST